MKLTGQKLVIYDLLNDVSNEEILLIAKYLYDEGFLKRKKLDIKVQYDRKN